MYFRTIALLSVSFLGASSARLNDAVADFEDVPTCGSKKKQFCNTGPFYANMKKTLNDAPIVEGFYVDDEETAKAQGAINELIFYFQKKCKNCVEEDAKDELCALKDPIYQGIFDWVSDTMKDTVATYCPPEDFVCGQQHYNKCNGDLYEKMANQLNNTPKNGGVAAPEAMNALNGFFTATCKSCVEHTKAKALCESSKSIVTGIVNNDDREYEDPTSKFCGNLSETPDPKPVTPIEKQPLPTPAGFDPSSKHVSYHDHLSCGPRGDDAKADMSDCGYGYKQVSRMPFKSWDTFIIKDGCKYWAYTVYECKPDPRLDFNPASKHVSYHDHLSCGPRGDDAKADMSDCKNGYEKVTEMRFKSWDTFIIKDGCKYWAYTVYECKAKPPAFDPASKHVSYHDHGGCGPRGDDAKANTSDCKRGYKQVGRMPFKSWDTYIIKDGCKYWAYTIYQCNPMSDLLYPVEA